MNLPEPPPGKIGWPWTETPEPLPETMSDGSPWTKISIVTPSFNQGQFIEETIRSVLLQGYPNLEFIIIDGGSTDNSTEIIKRYESWLAYWISEPDRGQSHAINKGIEKATGEILFWLNSDDLVLPGTLNRVADLFKIYPDVDIISGQARVIDENGDVIGKLKSYYESWKELITNPGNSIRQISTFFRRSLFDLHGNLDETFFISMDTNLLSRFTKYHSPLVIPDELTAFRVQPNAKTANQLLIGYQETDKNRLTQLTGKLKSKYRRRSSANWVNLAKSGRYSYGERLLCLKNALRINAIVIFRREFWLALLLPSYTR
ncbi:MAG: glycosyltransferase family 2 protein [Syntrophaceae bacterium]|nr:glycosyltransferase family 2 protein [Syntrophaceae bacterium]